MAVAALEQEILTLRKRRQLYSLIGLLLVVAVLVSGYSKSNDMTARSKLDVQNQWGTLATQWFLVSDLGLTALTGDSGIAANIRSLSTAKAVEGVNVRLLAVNNEILGEVATNSEGFAEFAAGLTRGRGGLAPGVLIAETGEGDYAFLDLRKPAFDLSDRGVEGRPAPGPLDVFTWTDRGIYKAGETVHASDVQPPVGSKRRVNSRGQVALLFVPIEMTDWRSK